MKGDFAKCRIVGFG